MVYHCVTIFTTDLHLDLPNRKRPASSPIFAPRPPIPSQPTQRDATDVPLNGTIDGSVPTRTVGVQLASGAAIANRTTLVVDTSCGETATPSSLSVLAAHASTPGGRPSTAGTCGTRGSGMLFVPDPERAPSLEASGHAVAHGHPEYCRRPAACRELHGPAVRRWVGDPGLCCGFTSYTGSRDDEPMCYVRTAAGSGEEGPVTVCMYMPGSSLLQLIAQQSR